MKLDPDLLKVLKPCLSARNYLRKFNTFEAAWNTSQNADWLLECAKRLQVDGRKYGACQKALEALKLESKAIIIERKNLQADKVREMLGQDVLTKVKEQKNEREMRALER